MAKLRVHNFAMSIDGYVAGPNQSFNHPLGVRGIELHQWRFDAGDDRRSEVWAGGDSSVDEQRNILANTGLVSPTIMGRNMFGSDSWTWTCSCRLPGAASSRPHPAFAPTPPTPALPHPDARRRLPSISSPTVLRRRWERPFAAANGADVLLGGGAVTVLAVPARPADR